MKEYIVHAPNDYKIAVEEYNSFYGEPITELIRCKDCKSYDIPLEFCWKMLIEREEDDFCSRARRKEECRK